MRSLAGVLANKVFRVGAHPSQRKNRGAKARLLAAALLVSLSAACSLPEQIDTTAGWSANRLYSEAKSAMGDNNWEEAIKFYQKLESRYPYGRFAQQAQMEVAYAYWKDGETDAAVAACDRFIKLHPNHPNVDYVFYLKGMINFNGDLGLTGYVSQQDPTERDPKSARESFDTFRELVQRFPNSKYTLDAIARMNYLVNALAAQEVHVARYYIKRGAFLAAANRAQYVLKNYPNAPAQEEALYILVVSYDKLGMEDLRADSERLMRLNYPNSAYFTQGLDKKQPWWKIL